MIGMGIVFRGSKCGCKVIFSPETNFKAAHLVPQENCPLHSGFHQTEARDLFMEAAKKERDRLLSEAN